MLEWVLKILLGLICIIIFNQDIRERKISLLLLLIFILFSVSLSFWESGSIEVGINAAFSFLYILLVVFIIKLYYYLKEGKQQKVLDSKLGWADLLVVFGVGVFLQPLEFVFFTTSVYFIAIVLAMLFSHLRKSVPLAGYMAVLFVAYLLTKGLFIL